MVLALVLIFTQPEYGYLTVLSDCAGLPIYVDGDSIGTTPLTKYSIEPGKYTVSVFSEDSFDVVYKHLKHGSIMQKLSAICQLARYDAGARRVEIKPNNELQISISKTEIDKARGKAKRSLLLGIGGIFVTGVISGLILAQIF